MLYIVTTIASIHDKFLRGILSDKDSETQSVKNRTPEVDPDDSLAGDGCAGELGKQHSGSR